MYRVSLAPSLLVFIDSVHEDGWYICGQSRIPISAAALGVGNEISTNDDDDDDDDDDALSFFLPFLDVVVAWSAGRMIRLILPFVFVAKVFLS